MMGILVLLQDSIESLHAIDTELDVRSYLVDPLVRSEIPGARHDLLEQLFVREEGDELEIALYVDPAVLGQLERDPPHRKLHAGNLENYCVAVEGISHFVLVAWRAQLGRPVTALELEIQAEVDKFVMAWQLLVEQGAPRHGAAEALLQQLFESWSLNEGMPAEEAQRYHAASRAARNYCSSLARRFGQDRGSRRIERDVRKFVRRNLSDKLRAA